MTGYQADRITDAAAHMAAQWGHVQRAEQAYLDGPERAAARDRIYRARQRYEWAKRDFDTLLAVHTDRSADR